jgi:hypothetical protein
MYVHLIRMSESYRLFLNAQRPINVVNANTYTYYVNWQSFLPTRYSKFRVDFSHRRNQTQSGIVTTVGMIRATLGTSNSNDQTNSATSILGCYIPVTYDSDNAGNVRTVFMTKTWDHAPIIMSYPSDNYLSVTIESNAYVVNTFLAGTALLFLNFTPIKDKKKKKRNISPRLKKKYRYDKIFH